MIEVNSVSYSYQQDHVVLNNISISIEQGEFIGLLGRNGAGKSTFIDLLLGYKHPSTGDILLNGYNPHNRDVNFRNEIAYLSHDIQLKGGLSVSEFLYFHSMFYKNYSIEIQNELLTYFDISSGSMIGSLSTGQQKKVQAIAGFASDTKIIIIDEITAVLDPEARNKFFKKILELSRVHKKTIILATNIAEDLYERVDRVLYIKDRAGSILRPEQIKDVFNV